MTSSDRRDFTGMGIGISQESIYFPQKNVGTRKKIPYSKEGLWNATRKNYIKESYKYTFESPTCNAPISLIMYIV